MQKMFVIFSNVRFKNSISNRFKLFIDKPKHFWQWLILCIYSDYWWIIALQILLYVLFIIRIRLHKINRIDKLLSYLYLICLYKMLMIMMYECNKITSQILHNIVLTIVVVRYKQPIINLRKILCISEIVYRCWYKTTSIVCNVI